MTRTLRVLNRTRDTVVVDRGETASTPWARLVGLMGKRDLAPGYGLLLRHESAIHSFGMRIPIDVVYLDAGAIVVRIDVGMVPSRLGPLVRGARDVLELPMGAVSESKTLVGDQLELNFL